MGEFKVINTQEELDALIKDRIDRERKSLSEKYSDHEELMMQRIVQSPSFP